jgi:hypothetical protein
MNLEYKQVIPVGDPYDLVVCGGGSSGIPAALHKGCVARNEIAPADVLGPRLFQGDVH